MFAVCASVPARSALGVRQCRCPSGSGKAVSPRSLACWNMEKRQLCCRSPKAPPARVEEGARRRLRGPQFLASSIGELAVGDESILAEGVTVRGRVCMGARRRPRPHERRAATKAAGGQPVRQRTCTVHLVSSRRVAHTPSHRLSAGLGTGLNQFVTKGCPCGPAVPRAAAWRPRLGVSRMPMPYCGRTVHTWLHLAA